MWLLALSPCPMPRSVVKLRPVAAEKWVLEKPIFSGDLIFITMIKWGGDKRQTTVI
jgi:hypothetical protein